MTETTGRIVFSSKSFNENIYRRGEVNQLLREKVKESFTSVRATWLDVYRTAESVFCFDFSFVKISDIGFKNDRVSLINKLIDILTYIFGPIFMISNKIINR